MKSKGGLKPPFPDRKLGERAAKGLVPPFHPKGKSVKDYKSYWNKRGIER